MKPKPIDKINTRMRLLAIAIIDLYKKSKINDFLLEDLEHIIDDENVSEENKIFEEK